MYGLTLPKVAVSNRLTREQGTSGTNIIDVPLCKVISGGVNNWALRQAAHGRTNQWENFRSRQEAIFCGVLMRALRSDQAEQEGTDFVTVLNAFQKKLYPASDLHDWTARYNTIKKLAEDVVNEFRKKAPVQANQTLLTRLQKLESSVERPSVRIVSSDTEGYSFRYKIQPTERRTKTCRCACFYASS